MQHNNPDERDLAFSSCPVPTKQLPVNEYRDLKESAFFRWATLKVSIYTAKLLSVWVTGLLIAEFFIAVISVSHDIKYANFFWSPILGEIAVLLCLVQLYIGWNYVYFRLTNQKIAYKLLKSNKTTVWYKSKSILMRDRLVARFQVRPILKRIKETIFLVSLFLSINFLILSLFLNINS